MLYSHLAGEQTTSALMRLTAAAVLTKHSSSVFISVHPWLYLLRTIYLFIVVFTMLLYSHLAGEQTTSALIRLTAAAVLTKHSSSVIISVHPWLYLLRTIYLFIVVFTMLLYSHLAGEQTTSALIRLAAAAVLTKFFHIFM